MSHVNIVNRSANRFALENEEGQELGYLDFHLDEHHYYLDYVYVNPLFRGQSVGQKIVQVAIESAQVKALKPVPICGYARTVMLRMTR